MPCESTEDRKAVWQQIATDVADYLIKLQDVSVNGAIRDKLAQIAANRDHLQAELKKLQGLGPTKVANELAPSKAVQKELEKLERNGAEHCLKLWGSHQPSQRTQTELDQEGPCR